MATSPKAIRCAVYTRKTTEHNLDREFNSPDARRESCEAYINSQMHEGWKLLPDRYDDGGISGRSASGSARSMVICRTASLRREKLSTPRLA
jgi:hypothetical protein